MVEIDALLRLGFSIITSFTNVVFVPPETLPHGTNELQKLLIGTRYSATDLYMVHRRGAEFWVSDGVVEAYRAPGSYFEREGTRPLSSFLGTPRFSSNQVVELAVSTVRRLAKTDDPLAYRTPVVRAGGMYRGARIPFYLVEWPSTNTWFKTAARIEIDARSGQVASLSLRDPGFHDLGLARQISNRVCRPDPAPKPRFAAPSGAGPVHPPTAERADQTTRAIEDWLRVCQQLRVDPGNHTNITDVDWSESFPYTWDRVSTNSPILRVRFKNGARFDWMGGVIINFSASDRCYTPEWQRRPREDWKPFQGQPVYRWQELASGFQTLLNTRFDFSMQVLAGLRSRLQFGPPEFGPEPVVRVMVEWLDELKPRAAASEDEDREVFMVEFDLVTGRTKGFGFRDRGYIDLFGKAQLARRVKPLAR